MIAAIVSQAGLGTLVWAGPMVVGLSLSIPFAVLSAHPALGRLTQHLGLCAIPEDIAPGLLHRRLAGLDEPEEAPRAA
jgi:membrane glycosyltransferase